MPTRRIPADAGRRMVEVRAAGAGEAGVGGDPRLVGRKVVVTKLGMDAHWRGVIVVAQPCATPAWKSCTSATRPPSSW